MFRAILFLALMLFANTCYGEVAIRMLILKHCTEAMADGDADLAIKAVNSAAAAGLNIKTIGNHRINRNGPFYVCLVDFTKIDEVRKFVTEQMKVDAKPGDTVMLFTIGHGMTSGNLDLLGRRTDVMKALADAAEANEQETVWWQLSCHACAGLPQISDLPSAQQKLFSIVASSNARDVSAAYVQGKHMEKLFLAMARNDGSVDANRDEQITAKEISDFLNRVIGNGRGDLVFAISPDEVLFGVSFLANKIPIVDRDGPQGNYPDDYIPLP